MSLLPPSFFVQSTTALPLVAGVVLYFYFLPPLGLFAAVFFALWLLGFLLDARITASMSQLIPRHEINVIFPALYSRFGLCGGCAIQFLLETAVVAFLPFLFIGAIDIPASSVVSAMFGTSHVLAFYSNKKISSSPTR
jgi:hypothetical protein